jgi:predicted nucleic acid-binding protein
VSAIVVDCSVVMAWCFEDECDEYADAVLDAMIEEEAVVPAIWPFEVANVLLVAERRGRLTTADSHRFVALLGGLHIAVEEVSQGRTFGPIISAGREFGLSAYDAAYLELAMRCDVPLATRDADLREACAQSGVELFLPTDRS